MTHIQLAINALYISEKMYFLLYLNSGFAFGGITRKKIAQMSENTPYCIHHKCL